GGRPRPGLPAAAGGGAGGPGAGAARGGVTVAPEEIIAAAGAGLPPEVRCEPDHGGVMLRVPPGHWLAALAFARERLDCDFFDWLAAVGEAGGGLSVVGRVYSLAGRHHVLLATALPRSSPRLPTAPASTGARRGTSGRHTRCSASASTATRIWRRCSCPTGSRGTRCARTSCSRPGPRRSG